MPSIMGINLPPDLKQQWLNVARDLFSVCRRCQGVGRRQEGVAAIRLLVFVNEDGIPVAWTAPKLTLLEPKNRVSTKTLQALIKQTDESGVDLGELLARS